MELMKEFSSVSCPCGKPHTFDANIIVGSGVIAQIPGILAEYSAKKIYLLADEHTYAAGGKAVEALMIHPLINSYSLAKKLIADYNEAYGEKILGGKA